MRATRKVKVTLNIDRSVLEGVDRYAARTGVTRSAVMEEWLARLSHQERVQHLEQETAAYYDGLTTAERREDAAWSKAVSESARRLVIDEKAPLRRRSRSTT